IDEWYEERGNQRRLHGDDIQSWTIPAHEVILDVMTGASAGGMCAAIGSVALREEFDHVRQTNPPAGVPVNRLYQSWVRTIDILKLLGTQDLPDNEGPVRSILDSTPIDRIAETALQPDPARLRRRPWVAPEMTAILTLSNLRGIPYSVAQASGSYEERIAYHADQIQFTVAEQGAADTPTAVAVNYSDPPDSHGWKMLQGAAMATGAFPVMLASRTLVRRNGDYENRQWHIATAESDGAGQCESITKIDPSWGVPDVPATFGNVYADGGVTNNNPFECARRFLTAAAGNENGRNPREPENANAAVISIAPFPGDEPFDLNYDTSEQSELINVLKALLGALVSQSRFQGEELKLTQDENVSSQFAIAPSDDRSPTQPALLCGVFSAFGGFIEEKFRDRDY
ncbi:MAG TPA: hypothetical protein VHB50_08430, partial [Bryobacteraceae bacterium]|nr:hypothetical protein [Bryobacteraceae bacterium]